jgi:hypothetical protein
LATTPALVQNNRRQREREKRRRRQNGTTSQTKTLSPKYLLFLLPPLKRFFSVSCVLAEWKLLRERNKKILGLTFARVRRKNN